MGRHSAPTAPRPPAVPSDALGHHRRTRSVGPSLRSSARAAGAAAVVAALAGAGLATGGPGTVRTADPAPDPRELVRPQPIDNRPVDDAEVAVAAGRATTAAGPAAPSNRAPTGNRATTVTPVAAARPRAAVADAGKTLWSADFASAGMGNFKSTPWNMQGAPTPKVRNGALDVTMPGGGKRAEVEPEFDKLSEGDEYYFGFSVRLADGFPVDDSGWQVITQFKNQGNGSPPLEVKVADGKFLVDGDSGGFSEVIGDARPGEWTHLVLRVAFSSSAGSVSAWQDGRETLSDFSPSSGTLYSGKSSYLKIGLYRDTSISQAGRLSFGTWAIGTSRGAVSRDLPTG